VKKLALIALAVLIALPASAAGVTISGYIDVGYIAAEGGRPTPGFAANNTTTPGVASGATNGNWSNNNGFALNEVNLDIAAQLTNDISAFVSMDLAANNNNTYTVTNTGRTDNGFVAPANSRIAIDYAYVDFANPGPFDLNVRAGRIPSVVGIEQRVSESNQNKFVNLSLVSPITVGSQDGVAIYGSFSPVNYAVAVSNSDNLSRVAAVNTFMDVRQAGGLRPSNNNGVANDPTNDNNNAKAVSGRIGVVPIEGLEVGASASWDRPLNDGLGIVGGLPRKLDRNGFGLDASYTYGAFGLKAEYFRVNEEAINGTGAAAGDAAFKNKLIAYYGELTYDFSNKYGLGFRYNRQRISRAGSAAAAVNNGTVSDVYQLQFAGVYRLADNVMLKAEYDVNKEKFLNGFAVPGATPAPANNVFALSLVGSF